MWLIVLWTLVALIFLVKIPDVRNLLARWRQMPLALMVACALGALYLGTYSYSKSGTNTQGSASSEGSVSEPPTQNPESRTSSMPTWWVHDETDTDGDGIPDLWEKWTHGNPLVADSHLDRDGDGLTDLEEFWNQTDPRTADTDGDGFSDAFEVAHGMDPLVSEDFTPTEPDFDNDGVIDIWEGSGYIYGFMDSNKDGFDDTYEWDLPAVSDANFDIVVEVYTTRSAVLTWENEDASGGIVILPTTSTSVRLRLPFGADTELKLLPVPEGTDLPSEELWKSRLHLSFAPRSSQTVTETCIIASNGNISQKVVSQATTITHFSELERSMKILAMGSGDGDWPKIQILETRFEIVPELKLFHAGDVTVGPFCMTNTRNVNPANVTWSASHGSMSPSTGSSSFLIVGSIPSGDKPIIITAEAELDEMFSAVQTAEARLCHPHGFSLDSYTSNFSPHLGETASFSVTLPGCIHYTEPGWLEAEVMRETTAGWQHVCWMDASQAQPGHQKRRRCLAGPQTIVWNGIATEGAAEADSPNVFTDAVSPFRRVLPKVISGEPVPPPYYTIFIRYREENNDSAPIIAEANTKLYVPQVVKIEMTDAAYEEFKAPILYPDTYWPHNIGNPEVNNGISVTIYDGCEKMTKDEVLNKVVEGCNALVPFRVNLRFTRRSVAGRFKCVKIVVVADINRNVLFALGFTPEEHVSWRNNNPQGVSYVYAEKIRKDPCEEKLHTETGINPSDTYDPTLFPFTPEELATALASTAVHEVGHNLGLVHRILYGSRRMHNRTTLYNGWIMNSPRPAHMRFGKPTATQQTWNARNHAYLHFILPNPQE